MSNPLTRYDHEKGCFVLAGTNKKFKCGCHPDSPFHWKDNPRPSMFALDINFRASGANISKGASERVAEQRERGLNPGVVKNISRDKEAEILRLRNFTSYLRAKPSQSNS